MKVGEEENRNGADSTGTAACAAFRVLRAATLDAWRRGDGPNKKSARRGTEHKTFVVSRERRYRRGSVSAGSNRQINTESSLSGATQAH
ncbi:hypothetical protein [Burkholderia seminalis]|uniref:hypothetical protein n=1 Tax=Burkholderia seminalis TaxID=488731 RepID=UPI000F5B5A8F|nr:hypothetical protein [Burkholderia seminalis]MCA8431943.1 hypothetical protein [Burkholderia seminalis]